MNKSKGAIIVIVVVACLGLLGWYSADILSHTKVRTTSKEATEAVAEDTGTEAADQADSTSSAEGTETAEATETDAAADDGDAEEEDTKGGIKLGLDLSGGVSITYQIVDENPSQTDINDTIAKLEKRAESYTTEYSVYQVGDDRITVEIPGVYDANTVLEELGSPGSLYFIKHKDDDGNENYSYDSTTGEYVLNSDIEDLITNGAVLFDGNGVKNAEAGYTGGNSASVSGSQPVVQLTLNDSAAQIFGEATTAAAADSNDTIGIYYDESFISVPKVDEPITDGNCQISGMESYEAAERLATFIRVGAINLKLSELDSKVENASMGSQALNSSLKAAAIGLVLVMIFMIFMYGVPGASAAVALCLYTTIVVSFIYLFEITLTLAGIAGIILGIGMAVDANVITFARIREEIAGGKTVASAITEGYRKAFSAILDGNVTTFIAAVVLMLLGSGTVKGFAYTLMISIIVSMFSALVVTRYFMRALYAIGVKEEKYYGRAKESRIIDFVGHRKAFFTISIAVIAAGIIGMAGFAATGNGMLNFSLEFVGGTSTTMDMEKSYTIEQIESEIAPEIATLINDTTSNIQATTVDGSKKIQLKTKSLTLEEREQVQQLLIDKFGAIKSSIETENISSTISGEMRRDAVTAVIVACIFMLLYIWFRFKDIRFAASAIAALVHDVLVVLAAYALIRISVGGTFIACMLTIVGYSVNDTIVIFDRIRENLRKVRVQTPESLADTANRSLTQTLTRSINTSITTIIMVLLLFILGQTSIREFALPLMVGLICGTYSSIFVATELWYEMKLHLGKGRIIKR